ncbi:MAG: hypothetical protein SF187_22945 [Deltaproteobacteria bacterium]|nr:hypothetical protein [Deltaproteobacteria bacterium]
MRHSFLFTFGFIASSLSSLAGCSLSVDGSAYSTPEQVPSTGLRFLLLGGSRAAATGNEATSDVLWLALDPQGNPQSVTSAFGLPSGRVEGVLRNGEQLLVLGYNTEKRSFLARAEKAAGSLGAWLDAPVADPPRTSSVTLLTHTAVFRLSGSSEVHEAPQTDVAVATLQTSPLAISAWTTSPTKLRTPRWSPSALEANGFVYVVGGLTTPESNPTALPDVEFSKLSNDKTTLGEFVTTNSLPMPLADVTLAATRTYLLALGGKRKGLTTESVDTIYAAAIDATSGALGVWKEVGRLPLPASGIGAGAAGDRLVLVGGNLEQVDRFSPDIYVARVGADGMLGAWQTNKSVQLPGGYQGQFVIPF